MNLKLNDRNHAICTSYLNGDKTIDELAHQYGLSTSRIRAIISHANYELMWDNEALRTILVAADDINKAKSTKAAISKINRPIVSNDDILGISIYDIISLDIDKIESMTVLSVLKSAQVHLLRHGKSIDNLGSDEERKIYHDYITNNDQCDIINAKYCMEVCKWHDSMHRITDPYIVRKILAHELNGNLDAISRVITTVNATINANNRGKDLGFTLRQLYDLDLAYYAEQRGVGARCIELVYYLKKYLAKEIFEKA